MGEFHSFTPPTGPSGGMSRDGHATLFAERAAFWGVMAIGVGLIVWALRKK